MRVEPRPRKLTVAVPVAPFDRVEVWPGATCGSELSRSSIRVVPDSLISWLVTVVIGAIEVRLGCGMREPVMTMSLSALTGAPVAATEGTGCASTGPVGFDTSVGLPSVGAGEVWPSAGVAIRPAPTNKVVARSRWRKLKVINLFPLWAHRTGAQPITSNHRIAERGDEYGKANRKRNVCDWFGCTSPDPCLNYATVVTCPCRLRA